MLAKLRRDSLYYNIALAVTGRSVQVYCMHYKYSTEKAYYIVLHFLARYTASHIREPLTSGACTRAFI